MFVFTERLGFLFGPGPNNEVILTCFDLFDIFVCIYFRCDDICRGKSNSKTISEPLKNNSGLQYNTTDANLELTGYG